MVEHLKKYFKPKSLTWWSGITLAGVAVLGAYGVPIKPEVYVFIAAVFGVGFRGSIKETK